MVYLNIYFIIVMTATAGSLFKDDGYTSNSIANAIAYTVSVIALMYNIHVM